MNKVCNFLKEANHYFANENLKAASDYFHENKKINTNPKHKLTASLATTTTLAVGVLSILGRGKLGFQRALPVAALGYTINIGSRVYATTLGWKKIELVKQGDDTPETKKHSRGCTNWMAQYVANPLSRGVVFGALFASVVGALKGKTSGLTLASVAAIAFAQAAEPMHGKTLLKKLLPCLSSS